MRTKNKWEGFLAWYAASCLNIVANRALFVPAPMRPSPKMAFNDTSESWSWLYLFSTSTNAGSGFDIEDKAIARGTALRAWGGPYLPICLY